MKKLTKPMTLGVLGLGLAGCQVSTIADKLTFNNAAVPGPAMEPAPLPTYATGDWFRYTNGVREQVVSVDGDVVSLLKSQRKIANFRNFILPPPYIESSTKEYFKDTAAPTDIMWPLAVGQSARFSTEGRSVTKETGYENTYRQKWSCSVTGTQHIRVMAGEFDTYVVKCDRRSATSNKWFQSITWNYAPVIGTYVLRTNRGKGRDPYVRELTAMRPSLKDEPRHVRSAIIRTWQTALEKKQRGEIASWTDKKTGTSVQVEPLVVYKATNGLFCRTYKQYLTRQGATRIYMGVACRSNTDGKWRTPTSG